MPLSKFMLFFSLPFLKNRPVYLSCYRHSFYKHYFCKLIRHSCKQFALLFSAIYCTVILTGCSQKFQDVNETMKLALFGDADAKLESQAVEQLPYASMYARIDDGPQAFMVLALAEPAMVIHSESTITSAHHNSPATPLQLKWLSADKGMLVTQAGRLVKTINLPQGNLVHVESQTVDPLALGLHLASTPRTWQWRADWQPGYHFGYAMKSTFSSPVKATLVINEKSREAVYVVENVVVDNIDIQYKNEYWLSPGTGDVLKSRQKVAPGLPSVEMTILKPFS